MLLALLLVPTPAGAADRCGVGMLNLRSGVKVDVMWASTAAYEGVFV